MLLSVSLALAVASPSALQYSYDSLRDHRAYWSVRYMMGAIVTNASIESRQLVWKQSTIPPASCRIEVSSVPIMD